MIDVGDKFPDFSLQDQNGNRVDSADIAGHKAVVYFYPKDDTTGCTAEACSFRDRLPTFSGAKILGVSPDSVKSHRKFADKFGLNFTLLADVDKSLCQAVGVWIEKTMYGRKYMGVERTTFVLDESGMVKAVFRKVKPAEHVSEVAAAL
jgi:peroxiredoxin Q/BCP